jgi:methionyl-tRNA formyltransferase
MNQDKTGGVTVIKMNKGMDTGEVIAEYEHNIKDNLTSGELMIELAELSAIKIDEEFDLLFNPSKWVLKAQDESKATYCYERDFTKDKFEINYTDGVKLAHGKIMAANPEPKAWLKIGANDSKFNLIRSCLNQPNSSDFEVVKETGELSLHTNISKKLFLELNDGFLEITQIQPEGKNIMDAKSFINGYTMYCHH